MKIHDTNAYRFRYQARSQDFSWGGGGGCVPQEPGPNVLMFE